MTDYPEAVREWEKTSDTQREQNADNLTMTLTLLDADAAIEALKAELDRVTTFTAACVEAGTQNLSRAEQAEAAMDNLARKLTKAEAEVERLKEQLDKLDEAYGEMLSGNGVLKDKLAEAEYAAKENRAAMDNAIKAWREAEAQLDRIDPSRLVDRGEA